MLGILNIYILLLVLSKNELIRFHFTRTFLESVVSLQILLVSGSKHPDKWVVPGGGIEPTEDTGVAAVREAMEEAGVNGILGRFLGIFEVSFVAWFVVISATQAC